LVALGQSLDDVRTIGNVQQYRYECGVEDAKFRAETKESITNQHRLIVCPSMIEQDFDSTQILVGKRGPLHSLFYQIARMVRAKGAPLKTSGSTLSPGPSASPSNVSRGTVTWLRLTTTLRNLARDWISSSSMPWPPGSATSAALFGYK
jgi:hypothetical protein